jgi:hypothetical protein
MPGMKAGGNSTIIRSTAETPGSATRSRCRTFRGCDARGRPGAAGPSMSFSYYPRPGVETYRGAPWTRSPHL